MAVCFPDRIMPQTQMPLASLVQYLHRIGESSTVAELTDGQLIELFLRDRSDAAFAAIVHRHGPMVFGVCRRYLSRLQDAEDAFQATFLVLAQKAATIRTRDNLANWLYGVSYRIACKARAYYRKSHQMEKQVTAMPEVEKADEHTWDELKAVVDRELSRLPAKYRQALVLCDLEGRTQKEAARQLGIPEGTVSSRLTRGRKILAHRLRRHGAAISTSGLAALLAESHARACLSYPLIGVTVEGVKSLLPGAATRAPLFSQNVLSLATGATSSMTKKLMIAAFAGILILTAVLGVGSVMGQFNVGGAAASPKANSVLPNGSSDRRATVQEPDYTTPIVKRAIESLGDAEAQAKFKGITFDMQSKLAANGLNLKYDGSWSVLGHDKYRLELTITDDKSRQSKSATIAIDGMKGWANKDNETEPAPKKELLQLLAVLRAVRMAQKPSELLAKKLKLSPLGEIPEKDRVMIGLKIEENDYKDISLYFDKKTGLPVKSEVTAAWSPASKDEVTVSFTFDDFKEISGIKHFTKITLQRGEEHLAVVELSNLRLHEELGAGLFAKP